MKFSLIAIIVLVSFLIYNSSANAETKKRLMDGLGSMITRTSL